MVTGRTLKFFKVGLIIIAFFYYLFFLNKGIVLYDEGYYVYLSERVLHGEIPYKDFFTNYSPGYFYLLAGLFKIFGASLLIGRFFNLLVCLAIIYGCFYILDRLKVRSLSIIIISFLLLISFGYPLVNISIMNWLEVLMAVLLIIFFLSWKRKRNFFQLVLIGLSLGLAVFIKQNVGLAFVITTNFLIFAPMDEFKKRLRSLLILNLAWVCFSLLWIYGLIIKNPSLISEYLGWLKNYHSSFPFSYPPLSYLLQPLGIFKLLPYYLPLVFFAAFIPYLFQKKKDWGQIAFCLIPFSGLLASIYPASDLLHLYPFLGLSLVGFLAHFHLERKISAFILPVLILIASGFYLTFFCEYYRYELPYKFQTFSLSLPKGRGILVNEELSNDLMLLNEFLQENTRKEEYILVYPFSPMIYFLTDRKNVSGESIFYPRHYSAYSEERVLKEVNDKDLKFIVTSGEYKNDSVLSAFIRKQKLIADFGRFKVFKILK